jgi:hypothetical protein
MVVLEIHNEGESQGVCVFGIKVSSESAGGGIEIQKLSS